jgi:hypothetical protein
MQRSDDADADADATTVSVEVDADDERLADLDAAAATGTTGPDGPAAETDAEATGERRGGRFAGVRARLGNVFSPRAFLAALLLTTGGLVAGQAIPILGQLPLVGQFVGFLGVFLGGFVLGLVAKHRRYLETGVAGAVAAGLAFVVNAVLFTFATDLGVQFAAVGATFGTVAALLGHYFGRDLRDGLTRDVE